MDKKLLNDLQYSEQIAKINGILKKLSIASFVCLLLAVDCIVLWLVFLLCDMQLGFIICISLNAGFACAVAVSIILTDKLKQEKRFLTVEHDIKEIQINQQNKLGVMFFDEIKGGK